MRVSWVGLGAMGLPMASRLVTAGFTVTGFDQSDQALLALEATGGRRAGSAADAARGAEVLGVMVATADQVEDVLFGELGAAGALEPGAVVLLTATVGPAPVRDWSERLGDRGVHLVDAPVSGGTSRAGTGELLMMVAGEPRALDRISVVLDALSSAAPVVGHRWGDGQRMKLVNQLLCGVHIAAAAEALSLAEAMGIDASAAWDVVRRGAAQSFMLEDRGPRMWEADPPVRSAVDIFVKDMGLVAEEAAGLGHESRLAQIARDLFAEASAAGLGRRDDSSVISVYRS